jgi:hypothetical protein
MASHVNFLCIYFHLKMVVWPKHVVHNLNKIVNNYWNRFALDRKLRNWTNTRNRMQRPKFKMSSNISPLSVCVCKCILSIVARQRLGKYAHVSMNTHIINRRISAPVIFYVVHDIANEIRPLVLPWYDPMACTKWDILNHIFDVSRSIRGLTNEGQFCL